MLCITVTASLLFLLRRCIFVCTTVNKSELFLNAGLRFPSWLWCQNSTFNFNMGSCSSTIVASNVSNVGSLDHESLADVLAAVENLIKKLH